MSLMKTLSPGATVIPIQSLNAAAAPKRLARSRNLHMWKPREATSLSEGRFPSVTLARTARAPCESR